MSKKALQTRKRDQEILREVFNTKTVIIDAIAADLVSIMADNKEGYRDINKMISGLLEVQMGSLVDRIERLL